MVLVSGVHLSDSVFMYMMKWSVMSLATSCHLTAVTVVLPGFPVLYSHPMTHLLCRWKFAPLNPLHLF